MATTSRTHSDEHIEYWAQVFHDQRLADYGIVFEVFLNHPHELLQSLDAREVRPLLIKQKRVLIRLLEVEALADIATEFEHDLDSNVYAIKRDSGYVQPMRHTNHHRRAPRKHSPWKLGGNHA